VSPYVLPSASGRFAERTGSPAIAWLPFVQEMLRASPAGVDRDRAALVVGHERGFTFRVSNPEGLDVAILRKVVELVRYERLDLGAG
jgi:hypothetical protein